jgi:hypothetical protein
MSVDSPVLKALLDAGLQEITPETDGKDLRELMFYAMYLPGVEKVWISFSRRTAFFVKRVQTWWVGKGPAEPWAHNVNRLLAGSRTMRVFYDERELLHYDLQEQLHKLNALIDRKPLDRVGPITIWLVEHPASGHYRLISKRPDLSAGYVLSEFLAQSKLQAELTNPPQNSKYRDWCLAFRAELNDPQCFKVKKLARFDGDKTTEAVKYMRSYAAALGTDKALNLIYRVR